VLEVREDGDVVTLRFSGDLRDEDIAACFARLEEIALTERTIATVIDGRALRMRSLRGRHRDAIVARVEALLPKVAGRYRAQAFVLRGPLARGLARALSVVVHPAERQRTFARVEDAERWCREVLG